MSDRPIVCNMDAIEEDERERHGEVTEMWLNAVEGVEELPTGYGFRFGADGEMIMRLAEFVRRERLCCPFFRFEIVAEPDGPLWLRLMGGEEVKAYLREQLIENGAVDISGAQHRL